MHDFESIRIDQPDVIAALHHAAAYAHAVESRLDDAAIVVRQTHISWIFLVGQYAYKIKKPITTEFLDYGTLERRHQLCLEEVRLDSRYAAELYLGVVPITLQDGQIQVEGQGRPIEYAVKMRRFSESLLFSARLESEQIGEDDIHHLAASIADFHQRATVLDVGSRLAKAEHIFQQAIDNIDALQQRPHGQPLEQLPALRGWTEQFFDNHLSEFERRVTDGFVRECHGDLHLQNVVFWHGQPTPFDGIEFNDEFRWIDVLSDAAFVTMDFAARRQPEMGHCFINHYLARTADYGSLALLRWYLVYRALVRAKVAMIRANQADAQHESTENFLADCDAHLCLAGRYIDPPPPRLWITHGLSGSGKSTASQRIVNRYGAIQLRSDTQRKRQFGLPLLERTTPQQASQVYADAATEMIYQQLRELAGTILAAGFSVVVDATFLTKARRQSFQALAQQRGLEFGILHCQADVPTLRARLARRLAGGGDASDADWQVLQAQLETQEPLTTAEQTYVMDWE
jgi:aminoglycoside phosphotransferase family enzyme/predicted kinase